MTQPTIEIDVRSIAALSDKLGILTSETLGNATVSAINKVVTRTYDMTRERMIAGLNLSDSYVTSKMQLRVADNPLKPSASIVARGQLTTLGHYQPRMLLQAVKRPGRSKGNPALGIPSGLKPAGLTVTVTRGSDKLVAHGFQIAKSRDSEGNALVFLRGSNGKIRSALGPSVYQLFRTQVQQNIDKIKDDLETTVADEAYAAIQELLT